MICLLFSSMVLLLSGFLGSASDSSPEALPRVEWYSYNAPEYEPQLKDEGPEPSAANSLWIVDITGKERNTTLTAPENAWIRLKLSPKAKGELSLYCRYPTDSVDLVLTERVEGGHSYEAWYQTQLPGEYELWYTVDGVRSNTVALNVSLWGDWVYETYMSEAMPMAAAPVGMAPPGAFGGAPKMAAKPSIGFSAGGAKDIGNFRENIDGGYLPLPTDVTYEGLFYDYYFETGQAKECQKLFCPSYSYAVSMDPISLEPQHYLSVGLNSGLQDFQRKKLNLVVVLDYSGSMGSPFDQYYYDRFGNKVEVTEDVGKDKMQIANEAVVALLGHLRDDDRFGMVIFSDDAFVLDPMSLVGEKNTTKLEERILQIDDDAGTNMEAGMAKGTKLLDRYLSADPGEYENRIIFLTDAMPNLGGTSRGELSSILEDNAARRLYTTFIGMGVDFNTELVEYITKIRGANYYSVHSSSEFKERMDEEFEYMVTPLVFNLQLNLNATGYEIEKVYGSPEADEATGEIMKVNTLFPSKAQAGQVKGGIILIKLKKISPEGEMRLRVSYEDRNGTLDSDEADVMIGNETPDFYQNSGIRKAVLLSRYADLLKNWMIDERSGLSENKVMPSVTLENGIVVPVVLGEWERQSLPLVVSEPYRMLFGNFSKYFEAERAAIGDPDLQQEQVILDKLGSYEAKVTDQGQKSSSPDKIEDKGAWLKELRKLVREGLGIGS